MSHRRWPPWPSFLRFLLSYAVAIWGSAADAMAAPPAAPASVPRTTRGPQAMALWACAGLAEARVDPARASREARVRWAAAVPHVSFRAHLGEGGYRRIDGDLFSTAETLTANRGLELRLTWALDELVYRDAELTNTRFFADRQAANERLAHQCAETASRWLRLRLDPLHDDAEERAAYTALDILTGGGLSRIDAGRIPEASP